MIGILVSIVATVTLFIAMYGWGDILVRWFFGSRQVAPGFSAAVGCASWVFVGGVLNAAGLVSVISIDAILISGGALALFAFFQARGKSSSVGSPGDRIPLVLITMATGFFAVTIVPTAAFNVHDDFHTYLVYPFEMLQTGSASLLPGDLLGYGTLTAQSFFQSVLLVHLPIPFVNAFDLLFCFFAGGLLLDEIGKKAGIGLPYRLIALAAFVVINPQYVNISALYSGSLMILGLIFSSMLLVQAGPQNYGERALRIIPVALFTSALAVLKLTFLSFVVVYMGMFVLLLPVTGWKIREALGIGLVMAVATIVFASPWVFVTISSYTEIVAQAVGKLLDSQMATGGSVVTARGPLGLFSLARLNWGGSYIAYTLMLVAIGVVGVALIGRQFGMTREHRNPVDIVWISASLAVLASTLLLTFQVRPDLAIRYSCPILIAVFPLTVSMIGSTPTSMPASGKTFSMSSFGRVLLIAQILVVALFLEVFAANLVKAYKQGTRIAFAMPSQYFAYVRGALSDVTRERVRKAQNTIPEEDPVFAWMATPFHLDFSRNSLVVLDTPGLEALAESIDFDAGPKELEDYFRDQDIRYLMWTRQGLGMRSESRLRGELGTHRHLSARRNLYLLDAMNSLLRRHEKIFDDDELVVIDLGAPG